MFAGKPVTGGVKFSLEEGICSGTITLGSDMKDWFNAAPQKDAKSIKAVGLDARGRFTRAALVTPFGAYDLRASGTGGEYVARFNSTRSLSITFL
jgi:hypothetical protein